MSKTYAKVCRAGHSCRVSKTQNVCECSAPLFFKDTTEAAAILATIPPAKARKHSAGASWDNKAGRRQSRTAYGDSETAARI